MYWPDLANICKQYLLCLVLMLGAVQLYGQSGAEYYFEQGNTAYRMSAYDTALTYYTRIENTGYISAELYYNIANCYYKLDEIGESILYYERALRLNPEDEEALTNLEIANLKVVDRIQLPPELVLFVWWRALKTFLSITQWSVLVLICYIVLIGLLVLLILQKAIGSQKNLRRLAVVSAIVTLVATYFLVQNAIDENTQREAIVLVPSTTVYSGPDEGSTDAFVLHEGVKINLTEQRGDWVRIRLGDGKTGWLKNQMFAEI